MPNLSNVTAVQSGGTIRVQGTKGSAVTVRVFLNPDLTRFPTNQALYNSYPLVTTPKAEDGSTARTFDLSLSTAGAAAPFRVKVVSSDGKGDTPVIEETRLDVVRARADRTAAPRTKKAGARTAKRTGATAKAGTRSAKRASPRAKAGARTTKRAPRRAT